jgi:23S rRNA (uracil1939-C5)-methyltransferase
MTEASPTLLIESLNHEGRGVAHRDGKAIFVDGALTGETVTYSVYRKKDAFEMAQVTRIVRESPALRRLWRLQSATP